MNLTIEQQLAEWINASFNHSDVKEQRTSTISAESGTQISCCALGLAFIGKLGKPQEAYSEFSSLSPRPVERLERCDAFAKLLRIPRELAYRVDFAHYDRSIPASTIAELLRAGEF
jgi:hypothetical protein